MAATIKDVAREANLSISTVSKYINQEAVREENRIKIEQAIRKLGYVPSHAARKLRSRRTNIVGMITSNDSYHSSGLASEIERNLREMEYELNFMILGGIGFEKNTQDQLREYIAYMQRCGVDGLLISRAKRKDDCWKDCDIPVVLLESQSLAAPTDCVLADCTGGAYAITEHLIQKGHRKIAIVLGPNGQLTADERRIGYERACGDYGLPLRGEYLIEGDYSYQSGRAAMERLWKLPDPPTAVFASNYIQCLGLMEAVRNLSIRVPEDLSVVTFDDPGMLSMIHPRLTAVRQPLSEMAETACRLLYRRMNGDRSDFPRTIRLKTECVFRDSVADLYSPGNKMNF